MKKMFISIALLLVMCVSISGCSLIPFELPDLEKEDPTDVITAQTETATEIEPDYTLYKPYMQEVLDNLPDNEYARAVGILYDVDGNGIDELIMLFDSDNVRHPHSLTKGMAAAYSVCTIDDGKVIKLENEHFLFPLVGGPDGKVFVISDTDQTYLAFRYTELNPGEDDDLECLGNMYIYVLDGKNFDLVKDCEYTYYYTYYVGDINEDVIDFSRSEFTVDGKEYDHEVFNSWLKSCEVSEILSYYSQGDEYNLETLMNSL